LDLAFNESKEAIVNAIKEGVEEAIVNAIKEGVEIFDPERPTCLRPNYSALGIGYFLLQKH